MSAIRAFWRYLFRRRYTEDELDEEVRACLEIITEQKIAHGLPPPEARRQALVELGGVEQIKELVRSREAGASAERAWRDVHHAVRDLLRTPGFTLVAVMTLTLAIGVNAAILSVADAVLFRPFPYADAHRVFVLEMLDRHTGRYSTLMPYAFIDAINEVGPSVSRVGFTGGGPQLVTDTPNGPQAIPTIGVNADYFSVLGTAPARGRLFNTEDVAQRRRVALLSYQAWQRDFGGDPHVVGNPAVLGGSTFIVIGVLPKDFVFPSPFTRKPPTLVTLLDPIPRGTLGGTFNPIVRVGRGTSRQQAQAAIEAAVAPVAATQIQWRDQRPSLEDVRSVLFGGASAPIMRFLLASTLLILLIGCANLANLLLLRSDRRTREIAMRLALGASRWQLIRPILIEAVLIGLVSAGLAVTGTSALFDVLLRQVPPVAYANAAVGVTARVVFAALALSVSGSIIFALAPAWRAARVDVLPLLRRGDVGARGRGWIGRPMVVAQVTLAVVAVFGAVVAARAFISVLDTPLGFSADRVVRIEVTPPAANQPAVGRVVSVTPGKMDLANPTAPGADDQAAFYLRTLEALRTRPQVVSVGASTGLPLSGAAPYARATLPDSPANQMGVGIEHVLPGFFDTVTMAILRGRVQTWDDWAGDRSAAVLSESAARTFFADADPLGQTFLEGQRRLRVVGLVADARYSLDRTAPPRAYVLPADRTGRLSLVVKVRTHDESTLSDLTHVVRTVDPVSFVTARWWSDDIRDVNAYRNPRFQTLVLGTLGLLALSLTALGVFGVVHHLVQRQTREMGVRLAIGAAPDALVRMVLRRALGPVLAGLALSFVAVRWITPLADAQLFQVRTHDPLMLLASATIVVATALVASYLPARRAAAIDPVTTLRAE